MKMEKEDIDRRLRNGRLLGLGLNLLKNIKYIEKKRDITVRGLLGQFKDIVDSLGNKIDEYKSCVDRVIKALNLLKGKEEIKELYKPEQEEITTRGGKLDRFSSLKEEDIIFGILSDIFDDVLSLLRDGCGGVEVYNVLDRIFEKIRYANSENIIDEIFRNVPSSLEIKKIFENINEDLSGIRDQIMTKIAKKIIDAIKLLG